MRHTVIVAKAPGASDFLTCFSSEKFRINDIQTFAQGCVKETLQFFVSRGGFLCERENRAAHKDRVRDGVMLSRIFVTTNQAQDVQGCHRSSVYLRIRKV